MDQYNALYYSVANSNRLYWSTLLISSLLVIGVIAGLVLLLFGNKVGIFLVAIPAAIITYTFLLAIKGYVINDKEIIIIRIGSNITIPLSGIKNAFVDASAMAGSVRLFGVSGMFSNSGLFKNRKLGKYTAYATNPAFSVVVESKKRYFVLTPEKTDPFVTEILERNKMKH